MNDNPQIEMLRANLEVAVADKDRFRDELRLAHEVVQIRDAKIERLEKALREVSHDFEKHGESQANYSDGEYTQDYTTRHERVKWALA